MCERVGNTLEITAVGLATIPVLAFIGPRVLQNDALATRVQIGLNYRTRNHMGSMYFGVLCAGADVVSGMPALRLMRERQQLLVPSFKDLHAEFLKRVESDIIFENLDIEAISSIEERTFAAQGMAICGRGCYGTRHCVSVFVSGRCGGLVCGASAAPAYYELQGLYISSNRDVSRYDDAERRASGCGRACRL